MTHIDSIILDALCHHLLPTLLLLTISPATHGSFTHYQLYLEQRIQTHITWIYYSLSILNTNLNHRYVIINISQPFIVRKALFKSNSTHTISSYCIHTYWTNVCDYIYNIILYNSPTIPLYITPSIHIIIFILYTSRHHIISYTLYTLHLD